MPERNWSRKALLLLGGLGKAIFLLRMGSRYSEICVAMLYDMLCLLLCAVMFVRM